MFSHDDPDGHCSRIMFAQHIEGRGELRKIVPRKPVFEGKPSNVSREIELLGKFIFAELASPEAGQMLDAMSRKLSEC
jgi:hypothetical protein